MSYAGRGCAAAAGSSIRRAALPWPWRVLVIAGVLSGSACNLKVPSGVLSCADGQRCPRGQVCDSDKLCRDRALSRRDAGNDAAAYNGDAAAATRDADAENDAGPLHGDGGPGAAGRPVTDGAAASGGQSAARGLTVESAEPGLHGVLEDLASAVKVRLSAPVDAGSVSSASVQLLRGAVAVAGVLDVSGAEISFKPVEPWALAADYELRLTEAIVDSVGHALEPFTLKFRTRDGRWQRERRVDGTGAEIALSGDGFAVLAWSAPVESDLYPQLWSAQFSRASGWAAPQQIKDGNAGAFLSHVVTNRRHHAAVAWTSISNNVSTTAYSSGPSWGPDAFVSQTAYHDRMLLTEQDELMIVADSPVSGADGIQGARFTLGAVSPAQIEVAGSGGNNARPCIALLAGSPHVIWQHAASSAQGAASQIMAGSLNSSSGTPLSAQGVSAANAVLASDPRQTSIIAAWEQADPSWTNLWVSRLVSGGSWAAPLRISDDRSSALDARLALDGSGRAVALWRQAGALVSAHFAPGVGWSVPEIVSENGAVNIDPAALALDAAGNGIATWTQDGASAGLNEVWAARYLHDQGWQVAGRVRVSDLEAGAGSSLSLGVDDYGRAFVIWVQENALWSGRFE